MKAAIVALAVVTTLAVCDARRRTTTVCPCLERCSLEYHPVCAQDPSGAHYLFTNHCLLRTCACRLNVEFTQLDSPDDCPSDARTKCPDQLNDAQLEGYGGDDDDSLEVPGARSYSSDAASSEGVPPEGRAVVPLRLPSEAKRRPF